MSKLKYKSSFACYPKVVSVLGDSPQKGTFWVLFGGVYNT